MLVLGASDTGLGAQRGAGADASSPSISDLGSPEPGNGHEDRSSLRVGLALELGKGKGPYWSVAFDPKGKMLLGGTWGAVHVWEVETGRLVFTYEGHKRQDVLPLAVGSGGLVLSGAGFPGRLAQKLLGSESSLHVWSYARPGWSQKSLPVAHPKGLNLIRSICMPTDNRFAVVVNWDGRMYFFDPVSLYPRRQYTGRGHVACSPSGKTVVSGGDTLMILRHEGVKWKRRYLPGLPNKVQVGSRLLKEPATSVDILEEADLVIAGGGAGGIVVYNTRARDAQTVVRKGGSTSSLYDAVVSVQARRQGDILMALIGMKAVHLLDFKTGKELLRLGEESWGKAYDARLSPDGGHLAAAYHDGRVRLWRISVAASEPGGEVAPAPSPARPSAPGPTTR